MSQLDSAASALERSLTSEDGRRNPSAVLRTWLHMMDAVGYSEDEDVRWAFDRAMDSLASVMPRNVSQDLDRILRSFLVA